MVEELEQEQVPVEVEVVVVEDMVQVLDRTSHMKCLMYYLSFKILIFFYSNRSIGS